MKLILAIFVAYFVFFSPIASHSNKGLKKVLSIVKDIKENMINVDDIVEALTPVIENKCGCCNVQESNPFLVEDGVILVTGGDNSVEALNSNGTHLCNMPDLPEWTNLVSGKS